MPKANKSMKKTSGTKRIPIRITAKRKSRKAKSKRVLLFLLAFLLILFLAAIGYYRESYRTNKKSGPKSVQIPKSKQHKPIKKQKEQYTVPKTAEISVPKKEYNALKAKKIKTVQKTKQEQVKPKVIPKRSLPVSKLAYRGKKPRLVIIIDDVHTSQQLHLIQHLPFPVTPSIFPPYSLSPHTEKLATQATHYMIHLPMESGNTKLDRQSKTLKTRFDKVQMRSRIKELRRIFPHAHYINNHTGSKFTRNADAMGRLYEVMKKEQFTFIDSRTTRYTKVEKIAHAFGDDYVARDIFLDNVKSVSAIHQQLKKAVKLAKKNGYAIAIGHPHKITLRALAEAKPLLKEVEIVYINEIFRRKR